MEQKREVGRPRTKSGLVRRTISLSLEANEALELLLAHWKPLEGRKPRKLTATDVVERAVLRAAARFKQKPEEQ